MRDFGLRQEGTTGWLRIPGNTKGREVIRMSDFEMLTVVFTVIGLLLTAYALGMKNK